MSEITQHGDWRVSVGDTVVGKHYAQQEAQQQAGDLAGQGKPVMILPPTIEVTASNPSTLPVSDNGDTQVPEGVRVVGATFYNTRVVARPGATLVDCESIIDEGMDWKTTSYTGQNGIMTLGDGTTLVRCAQRGAPYSGFNLRGTATVRDCESYGNGHTGLSVNHHGAPVDHLLIDGFYCEQCKGGVQLDTRSKPLREARLQNIRIGPCEGGVAAMKLATCDRVSVDGFSAPEASDYGLIFGEGVGEVLISTSYIAAGITYFPESEEGPRVRNLTLRDVSLSPHTKDRIWDHIQVDRLVLDNVRFPDPDKCTIGSVDVGELIARDVVNLPKRLKEIA